MLDRVHAHRAFADGGGALDRFQVFDFRVDRRLVLQIFAFEFDPVIDRRRLEAERDFFAGVQRDAAEAGGFSEGVLEFRRRRHRGLTNKDSARVTRASFPKGTLGARRAPSLAALTEIPTSSGLSPILQQKARNTGEFTGVIGDQNRPVRQCGRGDPKVVVANRDAAMLQIRAYPRVMSRDILGQLHNAVRLEQEIDLPERTFLAGWTSPRLPAARHTGSGIANSAARCRCQRRLNCGWRPRKCAMHVLVSRNRAICGDYKFRAAIGFGGRSAGSTKSSTSASDPQVIANHSLG